MLHILQNHAGDILVQKIQGFVRYILSYGKKITPQQHTITPNAMWLPSR